MADAYLSLDERYYDNRDLLDKWLLQGTLDKTKNHLHLEVTAMRRVPILGTRVNAEILRDVNEKQYERMIKILSINSEEVDNFLDDIHHSIRGYEDRDMVEVHYKDIAPISKERGAGFHRHRPDFLETRKVK